MVFFSYLAISLQVRTIRTMNDFSLDDIAEVVYPVDLCELWSGIRLVPHATHIIILLIYKDSEPFVKCRPPLDHDCISLQFLFIFSPHNFSSQYNHLIP